MQQNRNAPKFDIVSHWEDDSLPCSPLPLCEWINAIKHDSQNKLTSTTSFTQPTQINCVGWEAKNTLSQHSIPDTEYSTDCRKVLLPSLWGLGGDPLKELPMGRPPHRLSKIRIFDGGLHKFIIKGQDCTWNLWIFLNNLYFKVSIILCGKVY